MKNILQLLPIIGGIGLLRFLFAVSVVIEHSSNGHPVFNFVNGIVAVQSFFIISGFYMAMILTQKYSKYSTFIGNRLLRIYPIYYVVLLISVVISVFMTLSLEDLGAFAYYQQYLSLKTFLALLPIFVTNVTLLGQDIVMFMGIDIPTANLYFTENFRWSNPGLWNFLFIHQAWTLSLELMFYFIAPFINTWKSKTILLVVILSLTLRFILARLGFSGDPWTYRFFPTEIAFFLVGMLCYRVYRFLSWANPEVLKKYAKVVSINVLLIILTFSFNPITYEFRRWLYYLFFSCCLPWVFYYAKDNSHDRNIGELSYPIYISHILILNIVQLSYFSLLQKHLMLLSFIVIILSVSFSLVLNKYVQLPIEKIRAVRVKEMKN